MPRCSRTNNDVRKVQGGSYKRHDNTCRNEQKRCTQRKVFNSLTGEAFVARYDELTELSEQFATNFKISPSLRSKRRNMECSNIVAGKSEAQAASDSSNAVQDNTTHPTQFPSTSQVSWRHKLKMEKRSTAERCKNPAKEKREGDRTAIMSANDKCRTQNLVTNQVSTRNNKGKYSRLTKENIRNKTEAHTITEVENKSSTEKENCSQEIIKGKGKKKKNMQQAKRRIFSDYIPVPRMLNILKMQSCDNAQYVKGNIRVNPSFYKYAYLPLNNDERDLLIIGLPNRNRAFEGDLVVACINPEKFWHTCSDGGIQKTGKIVCILEKVHSRRAVGYIKQQDSLLMFYPKDQRVPLIEILPESMPPSYLNEPELYKNVMFLVTVDLWEQKHAFGRVLSIVGKCGEIDTELNAIILENNLDLSPYRETLLEGLPPSDYTLTEADLKNREDWRNECVFTIDPVTAVDIDDALSCKVLDNGNYEVGVHIADVTHYLKFFSPLDMEVLKRAITVYLPHMTFHMLPEGLCKVCSLLPGKDRLAFSVIWEITPNAEVLNHRFAKTVIKSCCQMSYDSAQAMIDDPKKSWPEDFLDIKGDYTASLLSDKVNKLFKLSTQLQNKRFVNGALKLEQPKLQIHIDPTIREKYGISIPINYYVYERKDSNSLIEEFMLLANMTVAVQLFVASPQTALLRIHKAPSKHCLNTVHNTLQKYGICLNTETAGTLQASIRNYEPENNSNSMKNIMMVLVNLCSKSMTRAEYVCASTTMPYDLKHYALNVPLYTHFTSPIRRYSDCIVHRLLSATLENKPLPEEWTVKLCSKIAANCNVKKYSAKLAQEQSTDVFFAYMVGLAGGFEAVATVMYVKEDSIEVILSDTGVKLKVNFKDIEHAVTTEYSADLVPTVTVNWIEPPIVQVINLFSLVHVHVKKSSEELRLKAILLPPRQ